ncbi:MAG TPA: hypothetical protein PLO06_01010 [Methanoregulaceae archaeon]|nr:hypothetical protein [Methanoregulaceae archaeon]HPD74613.1 hypothetical protein [Methanoregulaceae archaeon]
MPEQDYPDQQPPAGRTFLERGIPLLGVILIFISVITAWLYRGSPLIFAIAVALFSVGCVTLWFGFIHPAVRSGEERIERINRSADQVLLRMSKRKK